MCICMEGKKERKRKEEADMLYVFSSHLKKIKDLLQ